MKLCRKVQILQAPTRARLPATHCHRWDRSLESHRSLGDAEIEESHRKHSWFRNEKTNAAVGSRLIGIVAPTFWDIDGNADLTDKLAQALRTLRDFDAARTDGE